MRWKKPEPGKYGKGMPSVTAPILLLLTMITAVLIMGANPAPAAESAGATWGADYFPNVPLITEDGKTVRFFDDLIKDKVVIINFIFTRCPDVCPLETAQLREVQNILGDRVGSDVFMYSISIDPEYDTPEVLKAYTKKFKIGPGWTFLTGKMDDITLLRRKLGLYNEDDDNKNLATHTLSMAIGNQRTGRWMKSSPFENPYILATKVGSWLHNWKLPSKHKRDYADAPKLRSISMGESIFRTRCASCHTIGAKDIASAKRSIGPDLLGVTRNRDRAWLVRWLAEPDKMLAEKDPLATTLLANHNNVPMPNLSLNNIEIESLITYIETETTIKEHDSLGDHHH